MQKVGLDLLGEYAIFRIFTKSHFSYLKVHPERKHGILFASEDEHLEHLRCVLGILRREKLYVNLKKMIKTKCQ